MNFAKFASPASKSISKSSITPGDFEILLETCQTTGDFYMSRVLSSIYWNAVIGVYNAVKNQYGDHADTYIAMMEKQKADSADVVYWLHAEGFRPPTTIDGLVNSNSIQGIMAFVKEDYDIATETVLVINQHIRELKKHNNLLSARMHKARAVIEFNLLPEEVKEQYQAMVDNNLKENIDNQTSAMLTVVKMFSVDKDTHIDDLSPNKIYTLVSKLDEKVSEWINVEEDKKFIAGEKNDKYMVGLTSATLTLLDAVQAMTSKLVKEADAIDLTNTSEEITTQYADNQVGLNDQTDAQGVNQYNGGFNVE